MKTALTVLKEAKEADKTTNGNVYLDKSANIEVGLYGGRGNPNGLLIKDHRAEFTESDWNDRLSAIDNWLKTSLWKTY